MNEPTAPQVSVSVVCYKNDPAVLRACFESVSKSTLPLDVFIVDNSPTTALESLAKEFGFTYIKSKRNVGFGAAHNLAITRSLYKTKYHLVLNPDVYFDRTTLEKVFRFSEANPSAGIVSPRILFPDGREQFQCRLFPGPLQLFARRFIPVKAIQEKLNYEYEMRFADVEHEIQVPCIQGSFLFIRMAALQQVGLFDEAFFMYLEDFDLCRRIGATYRNFYFPGAVIYHEFARGSHKNLRLTWYHIQSAIHYFSKYGWFLDNYRVRSNETIKQSQTRQAA